MRRLLFLLPLILFAAVTVYFIFGLERDPNYIPSVMIDRPAPAVDLPPLPGYEKGLSTADLQGKPQLVNVFSSWCGPCRIEHPVLMRLSQELGVTIRGLNYKDRPEDAIALLKQTGNPYESIGVDRDGRAAIEWGVYGVPETFIIDGGGRIRYKHVGPVTAADADQKIIPIIRELQGWRPN